MEATNPRCRRLFLHAERISDFSNVRPQFGPAAFGRLRRLTRRGCIPLHVAQSGQEPLSVMINANHSGAGEKPAAIRLPDDLSAAAKSIARKSLGSEAESLAVQSMMVLPAHVSLGVSLMRESQMLAMDGMDFESMADLGALRLDTGAHLIANDGTRELLIVRRAGGRPGDAKSPGGVLRLAFEGRVDCPPAQEWRAEMLAALWENASSRGMRERLGLEAGIAPAYIGSMVDRTVSRASLTLLGCARTNARPSEIDAALSEAAGESEAIESLPLDMKRIASFLAEAAESMTPQLITGLAMLGHYVWGDAFFRAADRGPGRGHGSK